MYYDPTGHSGKSTLFNWIEDCFDGVLLSDTCSSNFVRMIRNYHKIFLFDFPRCTDYKYINFGIMEAIKNNRMIDSSYRGRPIKLKSGLIIIACNE